MINKNFLIILILLFISTTGFAISLSGETHIFAVTEKEQGMVATLNLFTIPGNGEVAFITSNSLVGKDTQTTGNIALEIAQKKTNISINNNNFIFDIKANASEVDGPSAGAAMTLLAYSVLIEKPLNPLVGITGTINSDGSVGAVGGIGPKAVVASEIGIKLLMIPTGQAVTYIVDDEGKNRSVNLLEYGPEKLNLKVVEVATIDEVLKYAYLDIDSIEVDSSSSSTTFIPNAINFKPELEAMKIISQKYIDRAKESISRAEKELELTDLDDLTRLAFYSQLGEAKRDVEMAQIFLDQNYLYSAANYSFNASVAAETIKLIAESPSLLSKSSKIFELKINDLKKEINDLKKEMTFIPINQIEWLIGAQQRLAYAENALAKVSEQTVLESEEEIISMQISKIREYASAKEWTFVAIDFFEESKKDILIKKTFFNKDFILKVIAKINTVEQLLIDANVSESTSLESKRRLNSAKISLDNNFIFAALYDAYFAEAFFISEIKRNNILEEDLFDDVKKLIEESKFDSLWANIYLGHANFYFENAKFEKNLGRTVIEIAILNTTYDLITLSKKIELAKREVDEYLAKTSLQDYVIENNNMVNINPSNNVGVEVTYTKNDSLIAYVVLLVTILLVLIFLLIIVGFRTSRNKWPVDINRVDKLESVLNRLDKAVSQKKITDAEYFFLKKRYSDEFNKMNNQRAFRSKITLNLDESYAKLQALTKGLNDLKKHYKSGLIIPEDYEKHSTDVMNEITEIKAQIKNYENELRDSRRTSLRQNNSSKWGEDEISISKTKNLKKDSDFAVLGTKEKEKIEKDELQKQKIRRKELLRKFKESKSRK